MGAHPPVNLTDVTGTDALGEVQATPTSNTLLDRLKQVHTDLTALNYTAAATFTPAATSHTAGDCNGAAAQFASIGPSGGRIRIVSASLEIDGATIETTAWTLYLYSVTPPSATADDGAWDLPSGDRASFLGKIDFLQVVDLGSTLWIEAHNINKYVKLAGTGLFGYLVNGTTLTPQAVAHIVTLHAVAA